MIGNIDGDLVAFRCAASVEPYGEEEIAILRADKLMRDLLYNTGSKSYNCYLSGKGNFRKKVYPDYKANRKDKEPPRWLQSCREYLSKEWNAIISSGNEADDLLGINQTDNSICISLDKDLRMIPGWHFNWLKNEKTYVTPVQGLQHLYKQMLIGDKADNIIGVWKIGEKKASGLIDDLEEESDMLNCVWNLYENDAERFWTNIQCLWIMRKENETWQDRVDNSILPNELKLVLEAKSDFMKSLMGDTSMELIMNPQMMSGTPVNGLVTDHIPLMEKLL
jgi:hypothetical protein